ncbi:putative peptidoglycan-linked protein [Balamuthia mandrillaris]
MEGGPLSTSHSASASSSSTSATAARPSQARFDALFQRYNVPLRLHHSKAKGRFAVATRDILPGEVLLQEKAWCSACPTTLRERVCAQCYRLAEASRPYKLKCGKCKEVAWCSAECQMLSQQFGKGYHYHCVEECLTLSRLHGTRTKFSADELTQLRLLIQIVCQRYHERVAKKAADQSSPKAHIDEPPSQQHPILFSTFEEFNALVSNWEFLSSEVAHAIRLRADHVLNIMQQKGTRHCVRGLDLDKLVRYICKLENNSHNLSTKGKKKANSYGHVVFNCSAMFNHSCLPNLVRKFDGDILTLRALLPIKEGEEATLTYVPIYDSMEERQDNLYREYHFECSCMRCTFINNSRKKEHSNVMEDFVESWIRCTNPKKIECDGMMVARIITNEERREQEDENEAKTKDNEHDKEVLQTCSLCEYTRKIRRNQMEEEWAKVLQASKALME